MSHSNDQPIKINEDLLTFSVKPNNEGVHKALSSLSSTVSTNGRVLEHSIHQHHSMRMEMTSANERLQEELKRERAARIELENRLASLQSAVRALEGTVVRKEAVQGLEQGVTRRLQSLEERATTVEKGECKTLTTAIYNSCTATLTKRVNEVEEELSIRLDEASDAVQQQVADLHEEHAITLDANITTRLEKMHQETKATLVVFGEGVAARQTELETRLDDAHHHMNTRLLRSKDELSSVMCTGFDRMAKWVGVGDHALDALFGVLCLDKGGCVELWNSMRDVGSPRPQVTSLPLRLAPTVSWIPPTLTTEVQEEEGSVEEGEEGVEPKQVSAEDTRRLLEANMEQQQCDELREIVMRHTAPMTPKATADRPVSEGAPNAMDTTSDPRVRFVSRTPHAVAMRAAMQREMSTRVEVLRSELQHDMVSELLELQREIKGKVTSTKLGEMLTQYRDHQLYSTVKMLGADIQEVKANKLDTHSFYEAVKGKADTRALDAKVGYTDMEAQFSAVGDSTERLMRDLSKAHERLRHTEIGLRNLQTYVVSGGGVYATKQALDAKMGELSPSAVLLHPTTPSRGNTDISSPISTRSRETREALNVSVDAASVLNNSAATSALKFQVAQEREMQQRVRQRGTSLHMSPDQQQSYNPQTTALLTGADAYNSALVGDESAVLATAMKATRANKAEQLADTLQMERGPESIDTYLLPEEAVPDQTLLHSGFVPDSETCLRDSAEWQLATRQAADQLVRPPTAPKVPPRAGSASQGKRAPLLSQTRHAASASNTTPVNLHIGGFPSSRPNSASIVAIPPPSVPLTRSQVDYCDQLGLDRAATGKVLQQARPAELAREVKQTAPKRLPRL